MLGLLDDVQVVELTHSLAGAFCASCWPIRRADAET